MRRALASGSLTLMTFALALTASAAEARDRRMTGAEFEAYATGKTLTYGMAGQIFGTEQYLPGRRVRWAFTESACRIGHWYEADGLICFVYEDRNTPQCWEFWRDAGGLRARFAGDPNGTELSEVRQSPGPLSCPGPEVGV